DGQFVKFQPTARPADVNGDGKRDLAIYGWTGGMHCCFTHFIIDGMTGTVLGSFEQAGDTPAQLVRLQDRPERAVLVIDDTASRDLAELADEPADAASSGPAWPSSRAIAIVGWNRVANRLALDQELMASSGPDLPAPYWQSQPALAQAVAAKTGADGFEPPRGLLQRGELSRSYKIWLETLHDAMSESVRSQAPAAEPVRAYLDEMVYKGHAQAAFAQIETASRRATSDTAPPERAAPDVTDPEATGQAVASGRPDAASAPVDPPAGLTATTGQTRPAATPQPVTLAPPGAVTAIVSAYLRDLRASPWFADLDRMNGGALSRPPAIAVP
ncbi:MAG: hypothetical protein MUF14_03100, partial [Hyphomonadaceae bacterium]|nr:hypothetical protein [Hyphomonadaceae bacterium]